MPLRGEFSSPSLAPSFVGAISLPPGVEFAEVGAIASPPVGYFPELAIVAVITGHRAQLAALPAQGEIIAVPLREEHGVHTVAAIVAAITGRRAQLAAVPAQGEIIAAPLRGEQ